MMTTARDIHSVNTFPLLGRLGVCLVLLFFFFLPLATYGQTWEENQDAGTINIADGLEYKAEIQATASDGKTPLWLNANRYGLSSLDDMNGYVRGALIRPLCSDSLRRWGVGYGVDAAVTEGFTSRLVVQQAFAEVRWLYGVLTIGSKQQHLELKNQELSTGSQTFGINARPVPQVRLSLPDYWVIPKTNGWLRVKGHIAYGKTTDDRWQKDFVTYPARYTENTLYHSKAGYLMIGNPERYMPVSVELGLEMACQFGGKSYYNDEMAQGGTGLSSFIHAFIPGGTDATDGDYKNAEGNHLGSYVARVNLDQETWGASLYADQFFEDNSMSVHLAYNGYGEGETAWQHVKRRYFIYNFNDWMLGGEVKLKYANWLNGVVIEYLTTKYQGGPTYHDVTGNRGEHITGLDNYYNHHLYTGWQHWGQVMGNPLYLSPIYNGDGRIIVEDNRFQAIHLGISGQPDDNLHYRLLATWRSGLGSYYHVYPKAKRNISVMAEANYKFSDTSALKGWSVKGAVGMDNGKWVGNNFGAQITVAKQGLVSCFD